jgi:hypothetical protein
MTVWRFFISLELCLGLTVLICTSLAAGSFDLYGDYAAAINSMSLFTWLKETPLTFSWWLWITIALLALLVLNTVICSAETVRSRWGTCGTVSLLAPQLMHAGFMLMILAHLLSAAGASHHVIEVGELTLARLPDGSTFGIASISVVSSSQGMPISISSELVPDINRPADRVVISPNHPWFFKGFGVYIKQAESNPFKRALLEIHYEPGAAMAFSGTVVFMAGNILLLSNRSKQRENEV